LLEVELAKYSKGRGGKKGHKKDESDVLAALSSFRSKLQDVSADRDDDVGVPEDVPEAGEGAPEGLEVDNDRDWLGHRLHFTRTDETTQQALDHYEVIDPRARGRQAEEEERERKQQQRRSGVAKSFRPGERR